MGLTQETSANSEFGMTLRTTTTGVQAIRCVTEKSAKFGKWSESGSKVGAGGDSHDGGRAFPHHSGPIPKPAARDRK